MIAKRGDALETKGFDQEVRRSWICFFGTRWEPRYLHTRREKGTNSKAHRNQRNYSQEDYEKMGIALISFSKSWEAIHKKLF